jgi:hypothetical protein
MIAITFFFLMRPGEYTGTTSNDTPFCLQDGHIYIGNRCLDTMICTDAEINALTSVSYTFTTQNNGIRNGMIVHGFSGTGLCCPMCATARQIKYLLLKGVECTVPIASIYVNNRHTVIKDKHITDTIRQAMTIDFHRTGSSPDEASARSLQAGGDMALLCGKVD